MAWNLDDPIDFGSEGPGGGDPGGAGFDWRAGMTDFGKELLRGSLPGLFSSAIGQGIGALMPGQSQQNRLVDTRTPEQQQGSQMSVQRMSSLSQNPGGFGLPGDQNDPNTPAGRRRWDIVNQSRGADASRGMFTTGGSAQREQDALNRAIAGDYNQNMNSAAAGAMGGPGMSVQATPAQDNPWAKLLAGSLDPAIRSGVSNLLRSWGLG